VKLSRDERKILRVQCSMLHRDSNQLIDSPSADVKRKGLAMQLEAEQIRLMLEIDRRIKCGF
jgi:hypothetical protein